eukprot:3420499-Prymnesium_polylepis.1
MLLDILPDIDRGDPSAFDRLGTRAVWWVAVDSKSDVADPMNMPRIAPTVEHYPGQSYLYPHATTNPTAFLDYAMMNETSGLFVDPLQGFDSITLAENYWMANLLVAPMHYLPYFSQCKSGVKIGRPPSAEKDFEEDAALTFHLGSPSAMGGMPVRRRSDRARCECRGTMTFELTCPPTGGEIEYGALDCSWQLDGGGNKQYGLGHERVHYPGTGSDEADVFPLTGDFVVDNSCFGCDPSDGGAKPGELYPFLGP